MTCSWATGATASSQYHATCDKGSSYNACEATGPPDVAPGCGDTAGTWTPSTSANEPNWLSVTFGGSMFQIHWIYIYETYEAPFVTKVEGMVGDTVTAVAWEGTDTTSCGSAFEIFMANNPLNADGLRISTQVYGYEQIDAVQICGIAISHPPLVSPPPLSPPPPPTPPAAPPPCNVEVDLVLVLDNSGSVGGQRPDVIAFARLIVSAFVMGTTAAQIGYVEFHTDVSTLSALTPSLSTITTALDNAANVGSGTFLSGGIERGKEVVTGMDARYGVPKVLVLLSDGVQTIGGDDSTAIAAANDAKAAGIKVIVFGFGDVSISTVSRIASWPQSETAIYQHTADKINTLLNEGMFGICAIATDKPRGPPPLPPTPSSPPAPTAPSPSSPPIPNQPPTDCDYCSALNTAFKTKQAEVIAAGSCPSGSIADTNNAGKRVCRMWVDGRMWFVPGE